MTLVLMMFRKEGVFQVADCRVTRQGKPISDETYKQLTIQCSPIPTGSRMLLSFTGLAEIKGIPTMQWVRETLRGQWLNPDDLLGLLIDRLGRDVGRAAYWQNELTFIGGILENDGSRKCLQITNIPAKSEVPGRTFLKDVWPVELNCIYCGGSGRPYISARDKELAISQTRIRPRRWSDHLGLLAAIVRRAANADPHHTVSPWCVGSALLLEEEQERRGRGGLMFQEPGEPPIPFEVPFLFGALDGTEVTRTMMRHLTTPGLTDQEKAREIELAHAASTRQRP